VTLYAHTKAHRSRAHAAITRIQAKRKKGESDEADDAAQAIASSSLALADEVARLRELLERRLPHG